jgi:hypothetical protein
MADKMMLPENPRICHALCHDPQKIEARLRLNFQLQLITAVPLSGGI